MQYAVMIEERFARYLPLQWITHSVETDANAAYQTRNNLLPSYPSARVVEYHSREWEGLVR